MERPPYVNRRGFLRAQIEAVGKGLVVALVAGSRPRDRARSQSRPSEGPVFEVLMVTAREHYFDPVGLWIPVGATVRWVLHSGVHGATAYHPAVFGKPLRIPAEAKPWDSGILSVPGQWYGYTFTVEGVYDYYCLLHEAMGQVGRIVVGEPRPGPGVQPVQSEIPPLARMVLERLKAERIVREKRIPWSRR